VTELGPIAKTRKASELGGVKKGHVRANPTAKKNSGKKAGEPTRKSLPTGYMQTRVKKTRQVGFGRGEHRFDREKCGQTLKLRGDNSGQS